jgi:hypothetical protein
MVVVVNAQGWLNLFFEEKTSTKQCEEIQVSIGT